MAADLARLVENTIDAAIRSFYSGAGDNYLFWDSELQSLESALSEVDPAPEIRRLFSSVRTQRICLAFDVSNHDLVLELSAQFMRDVSVGHPSFSLVASLRAHCLHSVGAHEEEIREILALARKPEIQGSEYISALEHLAKNHPGSIPQDSELIDKMQSAIALLRDLGYEMLLEAGREIELEQLALKVASELRRINREKGEALWLKTSEGLRSSMLISDRNRCQVSGERTEGRGYVLEQTWFGCFPDPQ